VIVPSPLDCHIGWEWVSPGDGLTFGVHEIHLQTRKDPSLRLATLPLPLPNRIPGPRASALPWPKTRALPYQHDQIPRLLSTNPAQWLATSNAMKAIINMEDMDP
jgi:hypothetical protein